MSVLKGTQTEQNILYTFAAESMARSTYEFFGIIAKKEGYLQIARVFAESSRQERQHAKRMFIYLRGNDVQIEKTISTPHLKKTPDNLRSAAEGESKEWQVVYPSFAETAELEGFSVIARRWTAICTAEKYHEKRFRALLNNLNAEQKLEDILGYLKPDDKKNCQLRCLLCGYVSNGETVPPYCPICGGSPAGFKNICDVW